MQQYLVAFLICNLFVSLSFAQTNQLFNFKNGLSNSLVNQVYQDKMGLIWVATEDGLNRFDGQRFKQFMHEDGKPNSLKSNFIKAFGEDDLGNLWIGYNYGIQRYDYENESFTDLEFYAIGERIFPNVTKCIYTKDKTLWISTTGNGIFYIDKNNGRIVYPQALNDSIPGIFHDDIIEDSDGVLWIASESGGLSAFNPATGKVKNYPAIVNSNKPLLSYISSICEDNEHNIYIGTLKNGLFRLNKALDKIEKVHTNKPGEQLLQVKSLLFDSRKRLWVGTDGNGLWTLNKETQMLEEFAPSISPFDFSRSKIHSILEDNSGNIWLGIFQKGVFLLPETKEMFRHYGYKPFGNQSIGSSCILAIVADQKNLWVGTDGDGLYQLSKEGKKLDHILLTAQKGEYSGNNILAIHDSKDGYLWIGTYLNGMVRYNKQTKEIRFFKNEYGNQYSLPNDKIGCIVSDKNGKIWIGTFGNGVASYDLKTDKFYAEFSDAANSYMLPNRWVNDFYIDDDGSYWIASFGGLSHAEPDKKKITNFTANNKMLPSNIVYCIQNDSKGNLWIGTNNGLVKFGLDRTPEKVFKIEDGLPSNVICAIEEDEYNQLWISTHNGLAKLNPRNLIFTSYYAHDGIQANEFSRKASCKGLSKEIYFGGINGVTEVVNKNEEPLEAMHKVILTDIILFDKPLEIGQKSGKYTALKKSVLYTDTIELAATDNAFSIEFTTLELASRVRIDYEYMMEGLNNNWNRTDPLNNRATYTNMDPGIYKFRVRGVDKDKVSKVRELTIVIHPPWYWSNYAKLLWGSLLILIFYWVFLFFRGRIKHIQSERLNEIKMQFFINISHEIKTPLALIIDPLDKLLGKKSDTETLNLHRIMQKNAGRIYRLINQLLDIRKIDKGQILFKYQKTNVYKFIEEISESYAIIAANRNISFNITAENKELAIWIDPFNFEKVILNLLSNAFKFTPSNGNIDIIISTTEKLHGKKRKCEFVKIAISDTGIGIPENEVEKIFNRFYQVNSKETCFNTGTGIGLHLAKSMVELHKGTIYAERRIDCPGSRFIVLLPLGNSHLPQKDLIIDENILPAPSSNFPKEIKIRNNENLDLSKTKTKAKTNYKLMIVDDEEDIRQYLTMQLSDSYMVTTYADGKEAFSALLSEKPDLIISDILMPEMDGVTFCKKVKANIETSHIPVILLTALSKEEDRAEGIETGADMYLTKPFNTELLKKIMFNLLENRRKVIENLAKDPESYNLGQIKLGSHDDILMQKVMTIIKEKIADTSLNVETLADGIGMSRVHMHRKLKEITNQSARDFIRNIRMKQAAYLLINNKVNVSEIAYAVGYSNLSHFSSTFKAFYGISPKEYISKQELV